MDNLNNEEKVFIDYKYATCDNCVTINSDAIHDLLLFLTNNEFRFLMFMTKYIKGNVNILYYSVNATYKPSDTKEISDTLNIEYEKCKSLICSLVTKNILKIKNSKFSHYGDYKETIILNNNIFLPAKVKNIKKDTIVYYSDIDNFIIEDVIKAKSKPRAKLANDDRGSFEYQKWRFQALERDNYTCQCCGCKEDLEVHHIENYATNPELRLNIDNAVVLCKNCHSMYRKGSFHDVYGTYNNTKIQLVEYFKNYKSYRNTYSGYTFFAEQKQANVEYGYWKEKQQNIIESNTIFIKSEHFAKTYPCIYSMIKEHMPVIDNIYENFKYLFSGMYGLDGKALLFCNYRNMMSICKIPPFRTNDLSNILLLFLFTGLLEKVNKTDVPEEMTTNYSSDVYSKYTYPYLSNFYIITEFNDDYFNKYEAIANYLLSNNIKLNNEYIMINCDNDIQSVCYDIQSFDKLHTKIDSNDVELEKACKFILDKIESNRYMILSTFHNQYRHLWDIYQREIEIYFQLSTKKSNDAMKTELGIDKKGYNEVVVKSADADRWRMLV